MADQIKTIRCYNCKSLLELFGSFDFFAGNPFRLKCPVCNKENDVENFGSYRYRVSSIIEQRELGSAEPIKINPMEVVEQTPINPLGFLSGIGDSIKGIGIWIVVVLILVLLIMWRNK